MLTILLLIYLLLSVVTAGSIIAAAMMSSLVNRDRTATALSGARSAGDCFEVNRAEPQGVLKRDRLSGAEARRGEAEEAFARNAEVVYGQLRLR